MQLRTKITLAFFLLFVAFVAGDYLVEREITYRHFQELEEHLARQNSDRWVFAVEREITHLAEFAGDWTEWDDAYDFAQTGNPDFIESNLSSEDWFQTFNLPVLGFYNAQGEVVWERCADPATGDLLTLDALDRAIREGTRPLAVSDDRPAAKGILPTEHGLLLVASRAVVKTDGTGPAQGFAIFGRFLDDGLAGSIAKQTLVAGRVTRIDAEHATMPDEDLAHALAAADHDTVLLRRQGRLEAYSVVDDIFDRPTVLVRSDTPLTISAQGNYALWVSVLALGGAGLLTLGLQFGFVQLVVVRPLQRLIDHSRRVGASGDLTSRIGRLTNDEIGDLAQEFDLMVEQLAASRSDLVSQSRTMGQAEIASSVTHNLGNVLNSAVVALHTVQGRLDRMRVGGAAKAADMLDQHQHDLAEFFAADQKGRQLPQYLHTLAESLEADRAGALEETRRLDEQLAHMAEILHAQQDVAKRGAYAERVLIHKVISRALDIVRASFSRHGIEVHADLPELPAVRTDPVQLAQILVNLFTNAKEAMEGVPRGQRTLAIRLRPEGEHLAIDIQDSGPGFGQGQAKQIFQAGFTTKGAGHGMGLHFCAIAARQLGGSIEARNAVTATGAVFTLRIPAAAANTEARAA